MTSPAATRPPAHRHVRWSAGTSTAD